MRWLTRLRRTAPPQRAHWLDEHLRALAELDTASAVDWISTGIL